MKATEGRIFIDQSGTINSDALQLKDEELKGSGRLEMQIDEASQVVIVPITGDLFYELPGVPGAEVNVGQVQVLSVPAKGQLLLTNPYFSDAINFLVIRMTDPSIVQPVIYEPADFDFVQHHNLLTDLLVSQIFKDLPFRLHLGRFSGRAEAVYETEDRQCRCFAFAIAGAFEIEGRLLHPRDGLTLWNTNTIEIEALSNHAILLMITSKSLPSP
ncbi:hypothetical protein ACSBL2_12370 [Pedobacter sp. AW31-3R]|uniref:pirin family protein n=1 Tax=Pedobacter sp. AW31-3R TaxID=3445781 RepID=UPI003F9F823C